MSKQPELTAHLKHVLTSLIAEASEKTLSSHARRKIEADVREAIEGLSKLLDDIDPIQRPTSIFDPSNPQVVGRFVALAMVAQERRPLSELGRFYGSGVYAIYYRGDYPVYAPIKGSETPIYVGKAEPAVRTAKTAKEQGDKLSGRLREHRRNIGLATTLKLEDFDYRALVVQSQAEASAESYLIHLFKPIWNSETDILFGLGKHGDSADTRAHPRSPWDTLHPGRPWAVGSKTDAKTSEQISAELAAHFAKHPVFADLNSVLESFVSELRQL